MLKLFLTITLLVAVGVTAKRRSKGDNLDCQCKKLLKPEGGKEQFKGWVRSCAEEMGVTLPEERGGGRGEQRGRGRKHSKCGDKLKNLPENVTDCIQDAILADIGAADTDGNILAVELETEITANIDANRGDTLTDAQYTTITDAIPSCITDNENQLFEIFTCIKDACATALTP